MKKLVLALFTIVFCRTAYATRTEATTHKPIGDSATIGLSGCYKLSRSVTGPITIAADYVILNLNGYRISGATEGVVVNAGISHATVRNGTIGPITSGNGVTIESNCNDIEIDRIHAVESDVGIVATTTNNLYINNCAFLSCTNEAIKLTSCTNILVSACKAASNTTGIYLDQCSQTGIHDCVVATNTSTGFRLSACSRIVCLNCQSLLTGSGSAESAYGFRATDGSYNTFSKCVAAGTTTTGTSPSILCAGFAFDGTEAYSSIAGCSVSNTQIPTEGSSTAYGILLKETFTSPTEVVSANRAAQINTAAWCAGGWHAIVAGNSATNGEMTSYIFDHSVGTITESGEIEHGGTINAIQYSTDGRFLAIAGESGSGNYDTRVYAVGLDNHNVTLVETAQHGATLNTVAWAPDSQYLVTGGEAKSSKEIRLYQFNTDTRDLKQKKAIAHGATVRAAAWSPLGTILAVGGDAATGNELHIYTLNSRGKTLVLEESIAHGATINTVAWSEDGRFLAVGGATGTGNYDTRVYEFDSGTRTLTLRDSKEHGATVYAVAWGANGAYLATGGATATGNEVRFYSFDLSTKQLTLQYSGSHGGTIRALAWSPSSEYLLVGGAQVESVTHSIYSALQFPSNCIVTGNTIYGTHGNINGSSTGLSASSTSNLVTNNVCYRNDRNFQFTSAVSAEAVTKPLQNISGK